LTPFGQKVVERMNRLGMIIDAAHADTNTLRDITALTAKPVVDSHTDLSTQKKPFSRQRSWEEMEWVAKTNGLICTWPLSHSRRTTLADWAKEIESIKSRLNIRHVGLGTDGGGHLPKTVEGYKDIGDIAKLARAMSGVGLDRSEIQAYLGENFERVIRANLKEK
jgi:membrane dipeptidase